MDNSTSDVGFPEVPGVNVDILLVTNRKEKLLTVIKLQRLKRLFDKTIVQTC